MSAIGLVHLLPTVIATAIPAVVYDVGVRGASMGDVIPLAIAAGIAGAGGAFATEIIFGHSINPLTKTLVRAPISGLIYYALSSPMGLFSKEKMEFKTVALEGAAFSLAGSFIEPYLTFYMPGASYMGGKCLL